MIDVWSKSVRSGRLWLVSDIGLIRYHWIKKIILFQLVHRPTLWWYSNMNKLNFLCSQKFINLSPLPPHPKQAAVLNHWAMMTWRSTLNWLSWQALRFWYLGFSHNLFLNISFWIIIFWITITRPKLGLAGRLISWLSNWIPFTCTATTVKNFALKVFAQFQPYFNQLTIW